MAQKRKFTKQHIEKLRLSHTGKKQSLTTINKRRDALIGKKRKPFSKKWRRKIGLSVLGRKLSEKTKTKMSESKRGKKSYQWKGGISRAYKTGYYSIEYKNWRKKVFKRDDFICQKCLGKKGCYITAHHIKSFAKYPKLRYMLSNGITLCEKCHSETDNYKGLNNKKSKHGK